MRTPLTVNLSGHILKVTVLSLVVGAISIPARSQNQSDLFKKHHEVQEGPYVHSPAEDHPTSPAYRYSTPGFFTVQVNVNAQGENIIGDAANEPSITHDPNDPNKIAIGWRHFETISNSFRQAGNAYTTDAGQTWTFPGVIDPGVFRSDPVLDWDTEGVFYYNSLTSNSGNYTCQVFRSYDGGATWDGGTYAQGGDKQWMSIDKSGGIGNGNIYAFWTSYYSICFPNFFTRSVDGGNSYEDCYYIQGEPYWGTTVVNSNGDVYVAGAYGSDFMFAKSSDAQNAGQTPTWDVTTNIDLYGEITGFGGYQCPNPSGLLGQTNITVDSSGGPYNGYIYILCSVDRNGPDPLDVMFTRSTDEGQTWDTPVRVNDDPGNNAYQWFGTMSVAPDGRIDVVWLDTRDNPGSVNSALYYAYSQDGGETWSVNEKLSESFNPHLGWPQQDKMGDYFDMYSDETGAHLAWANTLNGEQDVYYANITPSITGISANDPSEHISLSQNFPNPCNEYTTIRYNLPQKMHIAIKVYDLTGREVAVLLNETSEAGIGQVEFDARGLKSGIYYYTLKAGNYAKTRKLMISE